MWSIKHLFGLPTLCVGDVVSPIRTTMWTYRSTSIQHSQAAWTGGLTMVLHVYCCSNWHPITVLFIDDRLPNHQISSLTFHSVTHVSRRNIR